jgi:hypothetical protein
LATAGSQSEPARAAARERDVDEDEGAAADELAADGLTFLYDENRELFAIGYRHASHSLNASFYDLLASEAFAEFSPAP